LAVLDEFAKLRVDNGEAYPREAYLYAADETNPSTWSVRVWESPSQKITTAQLDRAAAYISPEGFHGSRIELPTDQYGPVTSKLQLLYKGLGTPDADIPKHLHEGLTSEVSTVPELLLPKSDPRVEYQMASAMEQSCGTCKFFSNNCCCNLVEGSIEASCVCDLWTVRTSQSWSETTPTYQVFVDTSRIYAELKAGEIPSDGWIPFLPTPGRFTHPTYGQIDITPGQNREMVESVKRKIYQEQIPLDAEHESKLSGAVGWISDMRMNDDDSADAYVKWTDRGRQLIAGGQFKYVSPEWFRTWRDPATQQVYANVVAGGAITTRPFFKDKVLRALVASERGVEVIGEQKKEAPVSEDKKPVIEPIVEPEKTFTAAEVEAAKKQALDESAQTFADRLKAAEDLAAAEKTAREGLETRVVGFEAEAQRRRFTEIVLGRAEADGARWAGEPDKHVGLMTKLAGAFGEDSQEVKDYIEQQTAIAVQLKTSSVFDEIGSGAPGALSDPEKKLDELAKARQASNAELTYEQAYAEVSATAEGKKLYEQSLRGR
jgi:hypothetical protein